MDGNFGKPSFIFGSDGRIVGYVSPLTGEQFSILGIAQNSRSADYTTVFGDAGKHILHPTADNNARTFTIDASLPYSIGDTITFANQINTVTVAITGGTLTNAADGTTGSRTLAAAGLATALKVDATHWMISGTGLA